MCHQCWKLFKLVKTIELTVKSANIRHCQGAHTGWTDSHSCSMGILCHVVCRILALLGWSWSSVGPRLIYVIWYLQWSSCTAHMCSSEMHCRCFYLMRCMFPKPETHQERSQVVPTKKLIKQTRAHQKIAAPFLQLKLSCLSRTRQLRINYINNINTNYTTKSTASSSLCMWLHYTTLNSDDVWSTTINNEHEH